MYHETIGEAKESYKNHCWARCLQDRAHEHSCLLISLFHNIGSNAGINILSDRVW